jgi:hypothetical protein
LERPAYSLDLAPSDFFSVPEDKGNIAWRHFDDIDNIRIYTMAVLKAIPQNHFQNCFEGWTRLKHRSIASQWGVLWRQQLWFSAMRHVALLPRLVRKLYCPTTYTEPDEPNEFPPILYLSHNLLPSTCLLCLPYGLVTSGCLEEPQTYMHFSSLHTTCNFPR